MAKQTTKQDLQTELNQQLELLASSKLSHFQGELANPRVLPKIRRQIARLKTALRQAELTNKENK